MTIHRMDNVAIVVADLPAAVAFFTALGLTPGGTAAIEGEWVDRVVGLNGVRSEIAMMRTPDGHSQLELTQYHAPLTPAAPAEPAPVNALGAHRVMFTVDDLAATLDRLTPHGATLIGEITRYEDAYLLCYLRGPGGIVVALAEPLG